MEYALGRMSGVMGLEWWDRTSGVVGLEWWGLSGGAERTNPAGPRMPPSTIVPTQSIRNRVHHPPSHGTPTSPILARKSSILTILQCHHVSHFHLNVHHGANFHHPLCFQVPNPPEIFMPIQLNSPILPLISYPKSS